MLHSPLSIPSTPRSRPASSYYSSALSPETGAPDSLTPNTRVAFQWPPPSPLGLQASPKTKEELKQNPGVFKAAEPKLTKVVINPTLTTTNLPKTKTLPPQIKLYHPPTTPQSPTLNRDSYNRYRSSSTPNQTGNFAGFFPSLATIPRPKPATLSTVSKPEEFKIQRPQLSPAPLKSEKFLTVNYVFSFALSCPSVEQLAGEN